MRFKAVRAPWAQSEQYLYGWGGSLQIVLEPIPDFNVEVRSVWSRRGCLSVWPYNPMGYNEDVVSALGGGGVCHIPHRI